MRVTNRQMVNMVNNNLYKNAEQLLKSQERLSTQKLINRPSDDPIGMGRVLDYRTTISSIDQYNRNITTAKSRIEFTSGQLEETYDLISEAKQIAAGQSGGEFSEELRESAAQEIEGIYNQIFSIANTKYGDAYLFAGHQTDTQPFTECAAITCGEQAGLTDGEYFTIDPGYYVYYDTTGGDVEVPDADGIGIRVNVSGDTSAADVAATTMAAINTIAGGVFDATVPLDNLDKVEIEFDTGSYPDIVDIDTGFTTHNTKYVGDNGEINLIVGEGVQVRINATGNEVFTGEGVTNGTNIFDDLKELKDALEADPYNSTTVSDIVDDLAKAIDQVEGATAKQATIYKRLESAEKHWERFKVNIEDMLSKTEDADIAKAIVELQSQETAYEVSLASSAGMFDKSLIDFLR